METRTKELIAQAEQDLLHTYNRYQVVLDRGEGVYLYDIEGKKYLDFVAGIAVFALGYANQEYNDALKAQIDKLLHTSNYYYNVPAIEAAHKLKEVTGMDRVFFTNSGAEAVEGAIKSAMKVHAGKGKGRSEIIAMEHSFHGRTIGALSVTGNAHYREDFETIDSQVRFARFNDAESVRSLVTENTCAVILEVVPGEGGLVPADTQFLKDVRALCDEKGILLIFDEIQCGMGRTGSMFAFQNHGVKPDIMTCAKALGCGVPVGAFLMTEETAAKSLVPGDHGTTYGGNPFAAAAVREVLRQYEVRRIPEHVREIAPYFEQKLEKIAAGHDCILERRGCGLMQGLVFDRPVAPVIRAAMDKGLILINAGANILRFVPPLIIEKEHIDEMEKILEAAICEMEEA
ncbi:MAG: aspartate aminotransferase family protein [Lachnospiraceae bacterium]|nr:aspartate aminotransferase family protein [Lachnospiraceae bacterium]